MQEEAEVKIFLFGESSRVNGKRRVERWQVIRQLGDDSASGKHSEEATTIHGPHFDNVLFQRQPLAVDLQVQAVGKPVQQHSLPADMVKSTRELSSNPISALLVETTCAKRPVVGS